MSSLKKILNLLLSLIFPSRDAETRIANISLESFSRQATPLLHGREKDGFLILFEYSDKLVKQAIWEMKFHKNGKAVEIFANLMYDRLIEELSDASVFSNLTKPLLVPIPISKKTRNDRGYNQCELLCEGLIKLDGGNSFELNTDILTKVKDIDDQVGKSKKERLKNIQGCFGVNNIQILNGRNVLLIDDIVTTGATMNEAKRVLKNAGAKNILCVTLAH